MASKLGDALTVGGLRRGPAVGLLAMLIAIDLALIAIHLSMQYLGRPEANVFDLAADGGYGEFFQYAKTAWAVLLLILLMRHRRAGIYAAWAIVCAYMLVDDAFQLHERAGWAVQSAVPGHPEWATHIGEIAFLGLVGLVLVTVVVIAHVRAAPEDRRVSALLAVLVGLLVVFGVVVDAINHLLIPGRLLTTIEDGGELLALSLIVAFLFAVTFCGHQPHLTGRLARLVERPSVPASTEHGDSV